MQLPIKSLSNILFLDIETVSSQSALSLLDKSYQKHWHNKANYIRRYQSNASSEDAQLYEEKAAIFAEFGKVICISVGYFKTNNGTIDCFRSRSFVHAQEAPLLQEFAHFLNLHFGHPGKHVLVGHNIREFDVPFICRRMLSNNLVLPRILALANKRPWQIKHIVDTMDLWRFGDYKHYVSLDLLAHIMAIPSPKEDLAGDQVGEVYWKENDIERISKYCEKDVFATALVYLKLNSFQLGESIVHKSSELQRL
ncbi:MAG: 3'-5' exonuclease [Saprospiraceae bacterium]|nr:3'-5' exonuclease [Saprospiraceae bacterium]